MPAIDLTELVESLQREVNPPGSDLFPDATDADFEGHLIDSFWEAKLYGFFSEYVSDEDGLVSNPDDDTDTFSRQNQQLIILFAALRITRNELKNTNTAFRAKAGPVEFETQNSAQMLRDVLKDLQDKIKLAIGALSDLGTSSTYYIDSLTARDFSLSTGGIQYWSA